MRIVIFFAFVIFGILSCIRVADEVAYHREYSFEEKSYYLNGNVEYKKFWNTNPDDDGFVDEELLHYSEKGDTLSRKVEFYRYGVFIGYSQDTIDYRFFRAWIPNFVNEMLSVDRSLKVHPDQSLYMYVEVLEDSLSFSYVGMDMQSYEVQLFETSKVELEEPDFVFVAKAAEPLFIPKTILSDHQIIRVEYLRKKVFESDSGDVRQGFTTLFSLYEKLELQNMLELAKICEPYLSN